MTEQLLEGKLYAPIPRRGVIHRPRLARLLARVSDAKLTLVSAPPGFGKSTLLAERRAAVGAVRTAWLSLDASDSDPRAFWTHVVAALRTAIPGIGAAARSLLASPDEPIRSAITSLLNDLRPLEEDVEFVLDDYHVLESADLHEGVAFFLERLPERLHVVIATRADPPLPLARMRARGELLEIRAADLRFTTDEAAAYLNGALGLALVPSDLEALAGRTEGWIAALQLAALSMQGREDVSGFIAGFAGDDRYVIDYLVDEVLRRQPDDVRRFLLQTSILARMSGPLCEAVTGAPGGRATLQALDRGNLFIVPLDDRRDWYRYHHLFADVLRTHLAEEPSADVAELHRRASAWFEDEGARSEAIEHAMAGRDFSRAARLVELEIPAMNQRRQEVGLRRLIEALPSDLVRERPVLSVGYAGALLSTGEIDGVVERIDAVERLLGSSEAKPEGGLVVSDTAELERLPGIIAMYRAALALLDGDAAATVRIATQALDAIGDDHVRRGGLSSLRGLAHWTDGDLEQAYRWYAAGMASLGRGGHRSDVVGGAVTLADIRIAQGRLREAQQHYEDGLELATGGGGPALRGAADMLVGLAALACERNDLATAAAHLDDAAALGDENGLPKNPWRSRLAAARLRDAEGDTRSALALLDEAERRYVGDFSPDVRPVAALRARIWIHEGRLAEARAWAAARDLSATEPVTYLREFELATLARLLLAEGRGGLGDAIAQAMALAERLVEGAEASARWGSVLDAMVVGALARQASGDRTGAEAMLARALELGAAEGYVRLFLDEGAAMASLLREAAGAGATSPALRELLAAGAAGGDRLASAPGLVEPLSQRELDVLRLLASDLSGPQIAAELVVSLNTVRTHTKSIYAKLGVNSRRAAVTRAAELELLRPGLPRG